ncbi:hypothetical protein HU830_01865 [Lactobacillus sp. DCY120]|uniref:Saccharopine dehydrogenase n=1 Tax=Bombilactobacillus apium TaxID=2675299 RepID=A0A850QYX0_9LACO|nr:hypothetical protein [Bombilactobacillus apium]NVY95939.1 hypothetical protein [Bombilactobacillus apium]
MKKILVIGGTGVTGHLIYRELQTNPNLEIFGTSRRAAAISDDHIIYFDLAADKQRNIALLQKFDFTVIALGPFEKYLNKVQQLCIIAQVNCLDINDSILAAQKIKNLQEQAEKQKVTVLTGFGLCPGLSTLALGLNLSSTVTDIACRLYIGQQPIGPGAMAAMLRTINQQYPVLVKGKKFWIDNEVTDNYRFWGHSQSSSLIGYENPEMVTTAALRKLKVNYSYKVHFAALKKTQLKFLLKASSWLNTQTIPFLQKLYFLFSKMKRQVKQSDKGCLLEVTWKGKGQQKLVISGESSYYMTAMFACVIVTEIFETKITLAAGVYDWENLTANSERVLADLEKKGLQIKHR